MGTGTMKGLHRVSLMATEAARSVTFYRDLLGLEAVAGHEALASGAGSIYFGVDGGRPGTLLELRLGDAESRGRWGVGGVHHVALGTSSEEALLRWKRRLEDGGVSVTGPYDRGYFTSLYFPDPDGQVVEIATSGPGYLIDETPEALGRSLKLPPERLLRGHRNEAEIAARSWPDPVVEIDAEMRLDGIHHVSGITDDLDRALDWYGGVLGLDVIKRTVNRDDGRTHHYFWGVRDGSGVAPHSSWTLFGWPGSEYRARPGVGQIRSVAFRVGDDADLAAWRERLLERGESPGPVVDRGSFRTLELRAPDGQMLELSTEA